MFDKLAERLSQSETGLAALTNLLAAMVQAGRDTAALEAAIARALGAGPEEAGQPDRQAQPAQPAQDDSGLETGIFHVLEARESRPGVVRAYCQAEGGGKQAVFAKNGNSRALAGAVGKQVMVKYRRGDKGLIAVEVRPVA
ncbi:hypothetical protein [Neomoorella mulderi]|uniref:Uncharacterized protein n=1 Tax=Moorella mulderi DSM 14980 TaxID=1122241 RepID=A0A151AWP8_9FIRM|nr:hypothetical protein [Moorella mulderi]KYH32041.1 hypothetical protein MOMUL_19230 [Moorella mulderi DSM 14980]